jgi:hypothetical protein
VEDEVRRHGEGRPGEHGAPALLPVRVTSESAKRGEPVTVLLRTGHMLKVSHGFDEAVVALLERS